MVLLLECLLFMLIRDLKNTIKTGSGREGMGKQEGKGKTQIQSRQFEIFNFV